MGAIDEMCLDIPRLRRTDDKDVGRGRRVVLYQSLKFSKICNDTLDRQQIDVN